MANMARKVSAGDYQIGIYRVTRLLTPQRKEWEVEDREGTTLYWFPTLGDAHKFLTGEPMHDTRTAP